MAIPANKTPGALASRAKPPSTLSRKAGEASSAAMAINASISCPERRSMMTARQARGRSLLVRAWRQAREASPTMPPGRT